MLTRMGLECDHAKIGVLLDKVGNPCYRFRNNIPRRVQIQWMVTPGEACLEGGNGKTVLSAADGDIDCSSL